MEIGFGESFKLATLYLSAVIEAIAGLIIAYAVAEATWRVFKMAAWRESSHGAKEAIRLHLGRWLALVLEFLLAADILRTAVAPT
jgi:uncharacterized membrane protein